MRPAPSDLALLFEGAPRFIERLSSVPGDSWADFFDRATALASTMPELEQIELLDAHPRIGADPATVSALSYREQGYDRDAGHAALSERLDTLNEAYEARFGFRFVIFVNGRPRAEIADMLEERLAARRADELARGLSDVIAIARDRAAKLEVGA